MIRRIAYDPQVYPEPRLCLASMSERLRAGWQISSVEPAGRGAVRVVFRRDTPFRPATAPAAPAEQPQAAARHNLRDRSRLGGGRHRAAGPNCE